MPILDYDGTAYREIGKIYDYDGANYHQIGKVYDNDGTTNHLIYSAEFNLLENTSWSKHNSGYSTCTTTTSKVSIETNSASTNVTLYKQVDVTNYSKLTITCNISNVCYGWAGVGLQTSTTGTGEPVVGKRLSTSDGQILSFSNTIELDISKLTGNYYFSLFAYRGSGLNPKVVVTKAILS